MNSTQIYSATYSGVPVYEFLTKEGPVMRRKSDGWVNATHILKVANFPKAKRTRILERDVQTGLHEKVQGGYGKYQGTWVPLEAGKAIAKQFEVSDVLAPIFDYQMVEGAPSPPPAPKHHHASTLAKALSTTDASGKVPSSAAARKISSMPMTKPRKRGRPRRVPLEDPPILQQKNGPSFGVFSGKPEYNSTTVMEPVNASHSINLPNVTNITPSQNNFKSEEIDISSPVSDIGDGNVHVDPSSSPSDFMSDTDLVNALRSPQKQIQVARENLERTLVNNFESQSNSIHANQVHLDNNTTRKTNKGHISPILDPATDFTNKLLQFFIAPDSDSEKIPDFLSEIPSTFNIDQVIDNEGHTALHWACAMGSLQVIELFIERGANVKHKNADGETPIMRAVTFTNCYTKKVFPKVCELLKDSLFAVDNENKTVLHHISSASDSKARLPATRYYTEILLAKISEIETSDRLVAFINTTDIDGNSALHIVAHKNAKKCIKILLGYGARADIPNALGHTVEDYLLQHNFYLLNSTPRFNSYTEEMDDNYYNGFISQSAKPSELINGMRGSSLNHLLPTPHHSETAIHATQRVANVLVDSLHELSNAFDSELKTKESETVDVQKLLYEMNRDIEVTQQEIMQLCSPSFPITKNLEFDIIQSHATKKLSNFQQEISTEEDIYFEKANLLKKSLERSQAKDLAQMIQNEENKLMGNSELSKELSETSHSELVNDALELTRLQINRKRILDQIVDLHSQSSGNESKMHNYRRLIALCCDIKVEEVDNLLDGIEEVLKS